MKKVLFLPAALIGLAACSPSDVTMDEPETGAPSSPAAQAEPAPQTPAAPPPPPPPEPVFHSSTVDDWRGTATVAAADTGLVMTDSDDAVASLLLTDLSLEPGNYVLSFDVEPGEGAAYWAVRVVQQGNGIRQDNWTRVSRSDTSFNGALDVGVSLADGMALSVILYPSLGNEIPGTNVEATGSFTLNSLSSLELE